MRFICNEETESSILSSSISIKSKEIKSPKGSQTTDNKQVAVSPSPIDNHETVPTSTDNVITGTVLPETVVDFQKIKNDSTTNRIIIPFHSSSDFSGEIKANIELIIPTDWNIKVTSINLVKEAYSESCIKFTATSMDNLATIIFEDLCASWGAK